MTHDSPSVHDPGTFQYSCDEVGQPVLAIVKAVSWVKGVDVCDLEPLYAVVDIESVTDLLVNPGQYVYRDDHRSEPADLQITFTYEGCRVTVTPDELRVEGE